MRACEQRTTTVRTAYDALVSGTGDSCALAMAYKAVCDALNIPCQVVSGRFQGIDRCWNVVQVNGNYYHLDLSMQSETLWLRSDESMRGTYQWSADSCPTCAAQSFIWHEGEKL
jgi:transglutaminase-like putative cysteine protease